MIKKSIANSELKMVKHVAIQIEAAKNKLSSL